MLTDAPGECCAALVVVTSQARMLSTFSYDACLKFGERLTLVRWARNPPSTLRRRTNSTTMCSKHGPAKVLRIQLFVLDRRFNTKHAVHTTFMCGMFLFEIHRRRRHLREVCRSSNINNDVLTRREGIPLSLDWCHSCATLYRVMRCRALILLYRHYGYTFVLSFKVQ